MENRREFLKKAVLLAGGIGMTDSIFASIQRAVSIDPEPGSTFKDAEHVVILMQKNRSFDHLFGALRGVRGFNDPRVFRLANRNPAWLQSNKNGDVYAPFRLNIRDTKVTWMGFLPHGRDDQIQAFNDGKFDQWLEAKQSYNKKYKDIPLTMGYFKREDVPFYYALADAFTICDQHFCSVMSSTWPNRLYMWGGTIREAASDESKAYDTNEIPWGEAQWKTFPERLQDHNISWKVYQNDLNAGGGYEEGQQDWVGNFICNLLEWLPQYNVRFSDRYVQSIKIKIEDLLKEITDLESSSKKLPIGSEQREKVNKEIEDKRQGLQKAQIELIKWSSENFEKLSDYQKQLFKRAFTINEEDPNHLELTELNFSDDGIRMSLTVPKGDLFYQFRKDVDTNNLPTVSWLVAPANFSDHPHVPWYGTWYTSEILNILTKNPEVWKKAIFILTYDENDGYFDHIPPFVAPDTNDTNLGKCSYSANSSGEITPSGPIGLGYRVPLIIMSPWSRGGRVCSQVFDHTSSLQFLENFLSEKISKNIREDNITPWRRAVCGDLSSAFRSYQETDDNLPFLSRDSHIKKIYKSKFKKEPDEFRKLSREEIIKAQKGILFGKIAPVQECGMRPTCPLPYQLYVDGKLSVDGRSFNIIMKAKNEIFGERSAGSPFIVYAPENYFKYQKYGIEGARYEKMRNWHYAIAAGEQVEDNWQLEYFANNKYFLRVYGPNGFYREFKGDKNNPRLRITLEYERLSLSTLKPTGNVRLDIENFSPDSVYKCEIIDNAYGKTSLLQQVRYGEKTHIIMNLNNSFNWYDFTIRVKNFPYFINQYAGHVETGIESFCDPLIGRN